MVDLSFTFPNGPVVHIPQMGHSSELGSGDTNADGGHTGHSSVKSIAKIKILHT